MEGKREESHSREQSHIVCAYSCSFSFQLTVMSACMFSHMRRGTPADCRTAVAAAVPEFATASKPIHRT